MPSWLTYRSGSWELPSDNVSSPWYDGETQTSLARIPGSNNNSFLDTVTISGTHELILSSSLTVGDSGNYSNYSISSYGTTGTGRLTINSGCVLTIQSDIRQGNGLYTILGGSGYYTGVVFSATGALSWRFSESSSNGQIVLSGVEGGRVFLQGTNDQPHRIVGGIAPGSKFIAYKTDIKNMGGGSIPSISTAVSNGTNDILELIDCVFSSGGGISNINSISTNAKVLLDRVVFINTTSSYCIAFSTQAGASGNNTRSINRCVLDKALGLNSSFNDFYCTNNFLGSGLSIATAINFGFAEYSNNFLSQLTSTLINVPGRFSKSIHPWNYWHIHSPTQLNSVAAARPITLDGELSGMIFDPGNVDCSGTVVTMFGTTATPYTLNIKNNIVLPISVGNYNGFPFGRLINVTSLTGVYVNIDHNTSCVSGTSIPGGMVEYGINLDVSGMIPSFRSNLVVCLNGDVGYKVQRTRTTTTGTTTTTNNSVAVTGGTTSFLSQIPTGTMVVFGNDTIAYKVETVIGNTYLTLNTPYSGTTGGGKSCARFRPDMISDANYNAGWNIGEGTDPPGYNNATTGTNMNIFSYNPGINDIALDSNPFVDSSRNIATWSVNNGLALTSDDYQTKVNAAYNYIKSDPQANISNLVNWVKTGWSVNNVALSGAGHDGVTIGALPFIGDGPIQPSVPAIIKLINKGFGIYYINTGTRNV